LMQTTRGRGVPVGAIAKAMTERHGAEYQRPISDRWVGSILRKRLNLRTYKSNGVFIVSASERRGIADLCARYGVGKVVAGVPAGDEGTSGTSEPDENDGRLAAGAAGD
jgi:hypothetical protein